MSLLPYAAAVILSASPANYGERLSPESVFEVRHSQEYGSVHETVRRDRVWTREEDTEIVRSRGSHPSVSADIEEIKTARYRRRVSSRLHGSHGRSIRNSEGGFNFR